MIPALVVFGYLAIVLYIGIFAFRRGKKDSGEDFFLASRSLGPYIFLLSLFGTNMTAFAILGSSGLSYRIGIGVFGLMASASCFVIPLTIFFIGTRLWGLGKKFGHMTQVQYFRDRWECSAIGTLIFALTAAMLVPYLIIGTMGGGETLSSISTYTDADGVMKPWVSYEIGAGLVAVVVMSYVFFGGMRGTAWVNTFQTVLFLSFGAIAFILIGQKLGGFDKIMSEMTADPKTSALLTRARVPEREFFSYMFIPLSSIMFPHIAIMCMTAERVTHFKKTIVFYPICILLIWLPAVYIGTIGAHEFPGLKAGDTDDIIPRMLRTYTGTMVSGVLGAGIMACVMASDSQILALCTMFTEDIFAYYGGKERFGGKVQVWTGRAFIVLVTIVAYLIALALKDKEGIFELAIKFAFSGFAAMAPVMLAALFWKRSTKFGALAATLWVAATLAATWYIYSDSAGIAPKPGQPPVAIYESLGNLFLRTPVNVTVYGFLPVVPMCVGSAILVVVASLLTRPPSAATIEKYFPQAKIAQASVSVQQVLSVEAPSGVKAG